MADECFRGNEIPEYSNLLGRLDFEQACQIIEQNGELPVSSPTEMLEGLEANLAWIVQELDLGASWDDLMVDLAEKRNG
jgi:hypothetical protein